MEGEPGTVLDADIVLFEQEYFSARQNDSDSELDIDGESDRDLDKRTDDGDFGSDNMDVLTEMRELEKMRNKTCSIVMPQPVAVLRKMVRLVVVTFYFKISLN